MQNQMEIRARLTWGKILLTPGPRVSLSFHLILHKNIDNYATSTKRRIFLLIEVVLNNFLLSKHYVICRNNLA